MNIYIANDSTQLLGGGFSFIRNFAKGCKGLGVGVVLDLSACDVVLIPSSSMISKETFKILKDSGKKIVLRNDNIPKNSRNRNTGTSRLKMFAQNVDKVVYQSEWARGYVGGFTGVDGDVIMNGVDTSIYYDYKLPRESETYLYSRFNRDDSKMWEVAWYEYQMIHRDDKGSKLKIVGQFSDELREYNFDFYNGENIEYLGVVNNDNTMARIYNSVEYFLMPYYNDACSNSLIEAICCGCKLRIPDIGLTGGTPEILETKQIHGVKAFTLQVMCEKYLNLFKKLL